MDFWEDAKKTACFQVSSVDSAVGKKEIADVSLYEMLSGYMDSRVQDPYSKDWGIPGCESPSLWRLQACFQDLCFINWLTFHSPFFHDTSNYTWCTKAVQQST